MEQIIIKSGLSPEEEQKLLKWSEDVFDLASFGEELAWRSNTQFVVLEENGEPKSTCSFLIHQLSEASGGLKLIGLSDVSTPPQHQGKGYTRRLLSYFVEEVAPQYQPDFGLLFCLPRLRALYEKFGWVLHDYDVIIEQADGPRVFPAKTMTYSFSGAPFPLQAFNLESKPW